MHILGLDFATKTGVAYGDAGAPASRIRTETWVMPSGGGADVGEFFSVFRRHLDDRLMRGVELCVFEAPFEQHRNAPNQSRRGFGFAAHIEQMCFDRGIPCIERATMTIKKDFAWHGRAKKDDMIRAAQRRGFVVKNDHEADACALWLQGVADSAPEFLHIYDPIFARGSK